jgi:hypothetical protein
MVANTKDGSIPHTTDFHFHFWVGDKSQLSITHIGHLIDSKYLHGGIGIPDYIIDGSVSNYLRLLFTCFYFRFQQISIIQLVINKHRFLLNKVYYIF